MRPVATGIGRPTGTPVGAGRPVTRDRPTSLPGVSDAPVRSPLLALASMDADRERIEAAIHEAVRTADPYLTEIASHLIVAGGKRLRPVVAIAAAQVGGRPGVATTSCAAASPASSCTSARCTTTT